MAITITIGKRSIMLNTLEQGKENNNYLKALFVSTQSIDAQSLVATTMELPPQSQYENK